MSLMGRIKELVYSEHNQIALGTGVCIIILALFYKRILHIEVPYLENSLPGFVFLTWEGLHGAKKLTKWPWSRTWIWNLLAFAVVGVIMARRLWFM